MSGIGLQSFGQGRPSNTTSQPASSPFSFGTPANANSSAASTSLFGAPKSATPSLFGTPGASNAPSSGGLFGNAPNQTANKPTFSFGTPSATSSSAQPSVGLFGPNSANQSSSLFGQTQQNSQNQTNSSNSVFGGASQQQQPQQNQPQPQPPQQNNNLNKFDKFNELPDSVRSVLEGIENFIRSQTHISDSLKSKPLGEEISQTSSMYAQISAESSAVSNLLEEDFRQAQELKKRLEIDLLDVQKASLLVQNYKQPQTATSKNTQDMKSIANFPFEYFSRKTNEFNERLNLYKTSLTEIEILLNSNKSLEKNPNLIVPTLKAQNSSFMALASSVATLDLQLRQLKDDYREIYSQKTKSAVDPFRENSHNRDNLEKSVQNISLR